MLQAPDVAALEQFRALIATYCLSVDLRRWELLSTVFTDDATLQLDGRTVVAGSAEGIVNYIAGAIGHGTTSHHATGMVIEEAAADRARVVWSMMYAGATTGLNFGLYECDVRREESAWRIERLNRVRTLSV